MNRQSVEFEHPFDCIGKAWVAVPKELSDAAREQEKTRIRDLLEQRQAVLVAHYYVHPDLQDLAEDTGGFVGDSLEMARFGRRHPAQTIVVAGVRFMGETAKILSPDKRVLMPDLDAECSLDLGCSADAFGEWCDRYPDRVSVVYANTSAAVKAKADWVVTSSIALELVAYLTSIGKKILWAPDKHLGAYIKRVTGADMLLWKASCVVHDEFRSNELLLMRQKYPDAKVLAHPESPAAVLEIADVVGSTSQILKAAWRMDARTFIIATDFGIRHQLERQNPDKLFLVAPTAGEGATCKSCAFCPWMAMNGLVGVAEVLATGKNEITVAPELIERAKLPLTRMLEFAERVPNIVSQTGFGPA